MRSLPLLKMAVATATGAVAFLILRLLQREESISTLRRDIRDSLLHLCHDGGSPPTVLVTGFRSHGRSSFINTACRVLAGETGPLLLRTETAPPGLTPATLARRVIHAIVVDTAKHHYEEADAVELVDGPSLPEVGKLTMVDVESALTAGGPPAAECVVLVVSCGSPLKERQQTVKKLTDIANTIRERGLHLVVVLTHKKAFKSKKQAEELQKEVSFRARTDCVYFIENYAASKTQSIRHPINIKNDYETHFTMLAIIRQCIQFTLMYRNHLSRKASASVKPNNNHNNNNNNKSSLVKEQ